MLFETRPYQKSDEDGAARMLAKAFAEDPVMNAAGFSLLNEDQKVRVFVEFNYINIGFIRLLDLTKLKRVGQKYVNSIMQLF